MAGTTINFYTDDTLNIAFQGRKDEVITLLTEIANQQMSDTFTSNIVRLSGELFQGDFQIKLTRYQDLINVFLYMNMKLDVTYDPVETADLFIKYGKIITFIRDDVEIKKAAVHVLQDAISDANMSAAQSKLQRVKGGNVFTASDVNEGVENQKITAELTINTNVEKTTVTQRDNSSESGEFAQKMKMFFFGEKTSNHPNYHRDRITATKLTQNAMDRDADLRRKFTT